MSVWIDETYLPDIGVIVLVGGEEPALPTTRDRSVVIPGRPGAYDLGGELGVRNFELNCAIAGVRDHNLIATKVREFTQLLIDRYGRPKTVKLRFESEPDRFYYVRYSGNIPVDKIAYTAKFTVPMTAFDPYAKSLVTNDEVAWGSEKITFESQYSLGNSGGGKPVTITNATSLNVYVEGLLVRPVIAIEGSGTDVVIGVNGNEMLLESFENKIIIIDCENFTVTVNGESSLSILSGNFIELLNGDNSISISGTNLNLTIATKFRDQFI
ncbi:Phage-related protein [Niallia circulans]|uniref:phage tail domain-containing protein n=1 Tax=Niallia circulans TaxID=1397 RepID=UPI00077CD0AD|nr:phage tail domain-containing protein [Niallia circulans]MDR4318672.1 phage tail family protein [Niallia circulans]MED3839367.1 phage tail family protein [Niallia circulans]MED4245350.1 phage tail family protein [Niallia circulans]MED4250885.1 phage tail family protein [Niallia circulans]QKH60164.1 phage tail family protein [Niallia circulans]